MDIFKKFTARAVKLVSGRASAALFCDYAYANEMKTPVHPGYGRGSRNRGALEMEYAADGPEKVEEKIFKTGNTDPKGVQNIHVWYPASMEEGKKYPLLIISNGMEFSCTSFIAILPAPCLLGLHCSRQRCTELGKRRNSGQDARENAL